MDDSNRHVGAVNAANEPRPKGAVDSAFSDTPRENSPLTAPSGHGSASAMCTIGGLASRDQRERLKETFLTRTHKVGAH